MELIFDTCVLLYLKGDGTDFKTRMARRILTAVRKGMHTGLVSPPVLMELYYIISDKYGERNAKDFIKFLLSTDGIKIVEITEEMGMIAGEIYFKYNTLPKKGLTEGQKKEFKCPSACDCLIASVNKYMKKFREDTVVCTTDNRLQQISEINWDFSDIPTRITIEPSN